MDYGNIGYGLLGDRSAFSTSLSIDSDGGSNGRNNEERGKDPEESKPLSTKQRPLGQFEQAFTLTNQAYGLVVVGVLRLRRGPPPEMLRQALDTLQGRYPLLRTSIELRRNTFVFAPMRPASPIPLDVVTRDGNEHWQTLAQRALNQRIDAAQGPLMRCIYLISETPETTADLICAFHHAIVDAPAITHLYHELLSLCAALQAGDAVDSAQETPVQPPAEALLPPAFKGWRLARQMIPFIVRQVGEEWRYRQQAKHGPPPPLHPPSESRMLSLTLSPSATEALVRTTRRERVSLNSALAAALLMAVYRRRYPPGALLLRTIVFSNLRPYLKPPPDLDHLGSYISMLRLAVPVAPHDTLWTVARALNEGVYEANKRGDKYLAAVMSKHVMQRLLRKQNERMATTALSYVGPLRLNPAYGTIEVTDVHGFITTNRLSPELSAFGHLCFGRLRLDFMYLAADMDADQAQAIAQDIKQLLQP